MPGSLLGTSVRRVEDPELLTGRGTFVGNIKLEDLGRVAFVRSPVAHARIERIDTSAAASAPGVVAVLTAPDLDVAPFHGFMVLNEACARPPLATGKVRFVGEAVVIVVGETDAAAVDAAELVVVDYEPLPVVADMEKAVAHDAPAAVRGARYQPGLRSERGQRKGPSGGRGDRRSGPAGKPAGGRRADGGRRHSCGARRAARRPGDDPVRVHPDAPRLHADGEQQPRFRGRRPARGNPACRRRVRSEGRDGTRARCGHRGGPEAGPASPVGPEPIREPGCHAARPGPAAVGRDGVRRRGPDHRYALPGAL